MTRQEQLAEFGKKLKELLDMYEIRLTVSLDDIKKVAPIVDAETTSETTSETTGTN